MCFNCNTEINAADRPGRQDSCPNCGADLRCCRNCRFYDPGSYNSCREPRAERVVDKERANFCEWFAAPPDAAGSGKPSEHTGPPAGKNPLDNLFKK